jgi:hypothetical protein
VTTGPQTWSHLYTTYLASGTIGNCSPCHGGISTASSCYTWMQQKGQVGGTSPALTNSSRSVLSWYGGNMPPGLPAQSAQAVSDFNAWAAAGGTNN